MEMNAQARIKFGLTLFQQYGRNKSKVPVTLLNRQEKTKQNKNLKGK